jgi:hypothetical protein
MAYAALVERTVALPKRTVYGRLADFAGISKLLPGALGPVRAEGSGVGMVRTFSLKDVPGELSERLEALIEERLLSYSIISEPAVLPLDRYHAVVELFDAADGGCRIRWGSNWIAQGAPAGEVKAMLEGLYNNIIDGIVALG